MAAKRVRSVCVCYVFWAKHNDRNLVEGRGVFNVTDEIASLDFAVTHASPYIGRTWVARLRKYRALINNLRIVEEEIYNVYCVEASKVQKKKKIVENDEESPPSKRVLLDKTVFRSPDKPLHN